MSHGNEVSVVPLGAGSAPNPGILRLPSSLIHTRAHFSASSSAEGSSLSLQRSRAEGRDDCRSLSFHSTPYYSKGQRYLPGDRAAGGRENLQQTHCASIESLISKHDRALQTLLGRLFFCVALAQVLLPPKTTRGCFFPSVDVAFS